MPVQLAVPRHLTLRLSRHIQRPLFGPPRTVCALSVWSLSSALAPLARAKRCEVDRNVRRLPPRKDVLAGRALQPQRRSHGAVEGLHCFSQRADYSSTRIDGCGLAVRLRSGHRHFAVTKHSTFFGIAVAAVERAPHVHCSPGGSRETAPVRTTLKGPYASKPHTTMTQTIVSKATSASGHRSNGAQCVQHRSDIGERPSAA